VRYAALCMSKLTRSLIVEFIGTFFLVFTIGMTVIEPGVGQFAPLAIGSVLMVMIFAGGHISGAHYNPAVSLAIFVRGKSTAAEMVAYWVAQLLGAAMAGFLVLYLKGFPQLTATVPDVGRALLAELLFTFALCYVILNVATAKGTANNSFYGLAIGFTVLAGAYAVGTVSGAAFNPAVALGAIVMGLFSAGNIWIYLVANLAGGALAGVVFRALNPGDN
jgi:aquaporin Z